MAKCKKSTSIQRFWRALALVQCGQPRWLWKNERTARLEGSTQGDCRTLHLSLYSSLAITGEIMRKVKLKNTKLTFNLCYHSTLDTFVLPAGGQWKRSTYRRRKSMSILLKLPLLGIYPLEMYLAFPQIYAQEWLLQIEEIFWSPITRDCWNILMTSCDWILSSLRIILRSTYCQGRMLKCFY